MATQSPVSAPLGLAADTTVTDPDPRANSANAKSANTKSTNIKSWWRRLPLITGDDAGRPGMLLQVATISVFLVAYDALRNLAPVRRATAFANASTILRIEHTVGISPEHALNAWVSRHHDLALAASTFYDSAHYFVTLPLLAYIYVKVPGAYRRLRDVFVATNVIGLVGFWLFPLAPPRMLAGFVDTVAQTHALGGWSTAISKNADEYAAMPSLHIGWTLWVAVAVFTITRNAGKWKVPLRSLACLDVLVTLLVILSTGNHYVLDAIAGAVCLLLALGGVHLARLGAGHWVRHQLETPAAADCPDVV